MMNDELTTKRRSQFITGVFHAVPILCILLCILLGIACRFVSLNWDSNFHLHPDERFLTMMGNAIQWPHSWPEYFHTSRAPLNPFNHDTEFYVYGQLPLLLVKAAATLCGRDNYDALVLVGRALSAFCDCIGVLLVFLIAKKTGVSQLFGLFAAALFALTALNIQHAHFFVVDTFAATFILAAFYFLIRAEDDSSIGAPPGSNHQSSIVCGLMWGAAVACKFSSLLFGVVIVAHLLSRREKRSLPDVAIILSVAFIAFRLLHPIAFRGEGGVLTVWGLLDVRLHPQFWGALAQQAAITRGEVEVPFNLQWFDRTDYLWPLWNLGSWALGWPLLFAGVAGMLLVATRVLRRERLPLVIGLAALWVVFTFAFYGGQFSKFTRYFLPITPFISILAAWFCFEISRYSQSRKAKVAITATAGGVLLSTMLWSLAVTSIYTREHPRVAATKWIRSSVPARSTVANETAWDESLPLGDARAYRMLDLKLFEPDDEKKRRHLMKTLDQAQWIFISSPRVWKTVPRVPARYPLTTKYYRALFDGRLGFKVAREFTSAPQLFGIAFDDQNVEEALTVYDHPRVLLFRKTANYSRAEVEKVLPQTSSSG